MPSFQHEALLVLLRECPELVIDMVEQVAGLAVPRAGPLRAIEADFTQAIPTEFRADLVVEVGDPPTLRVIIESQRRRDDRKRRSWPLYVAAAHARDGCPTLLIVIAWSRSVARWARRPIESFQPGIHFRPHVIGPADTPVISDLEQARRYPALAVLSSLLHGHPDVARAALRALDDVDDHHAILFSDLILGALDRAARAVLEAEMSINYKYPQSDFARKHYDRGKEEGKEEGQQESLRAALLRIVTVRLGEVPAPIADRVSETADPTVLLGWIEEVTKAADDASVLRVFQPH